jgi:Tol biopolymer transport system component
VFVGPLRVLAVSVAAGALLAVGTGVTRATPASGGKSDSARFTRAAAPVSGTLAYQLCRSYCQYGWIEAWDLGQARARPLTPRLRPGEQRLDSHPSWSSDGSLLAFIRVSPRTSGIYVVGADGKGLRRILALTRANADAASFTGLGWSPDGTSLVFDRYGAVECSVSEPFRHRLTIAKIDGSGIRDVPVLPRPIMNRQLWRVMGWSPDGTRLLYSVVEPNDPEVACSQHGPQDSQLYAIGADGGGRQLLANADAEFEDATWSPDSRRVAYANCYYTEAHGGDVACDLAVVRADGSGRRTTLSRADLGGGTVWSAKGDEVIANLLEPPGCEDSSSDCTVRKLFAINASSGHRRQLGESGGILRVSSDGQYVAVWGTRLLLIPLTGGAPTALGSPPIPKGLFHLGDSDLYLR